MLSKTLPQELRILVTHCIEASVTQLGSKTIFSQTIKYFFTTNPHYCDVA